MNTQLKRIVALSGMVAVLLIASSDAFAFGRKKSSGYSGWTDSSASSTNNGSGSNAGSNVIADVPSNDANPVPEPTSMLLLGAALAGAGGYRKLKARFARRA